MDTAQYAEDTTDDSQHTRARVELNEALDQLQAAWEHVFRQIDPVLLPESEEVSPSSEIAAAPRPASEATEHLRTCIGQVRALTYRMNITHMRIDL